MTNQTAQQNANRQFANRIIGSDVEPCEVIREISERTLEVRRMDATLDPTWKPEFHVGGFCAHCSNQLTQRWTYSSDETSSTIRIRLNIKNEWRDANGNRYNVTCEPRKFHDYNF